ncbi:YI31B [Hepatospora eriocheir]|uniref:YI31B n=1 Tax=Hepatospora eriocheir TaxID=1081669 RepID=A0A1X0QHF0_9MICR|nr:YI31B [Hepatospora eriocheir]
MVKQKFYLNQMISRAGHDILSSKSVSHTDYCSKPTEKDYLTSCFFIYQNGNFSNNDQAKQQGDSIKFRGKVPGFKADEQPVFSISMLTNLTPSVVSKWIHNYDHLKLNCNWSDEQAMSIMRSIMAPDIFKLVSEENTANDMLVLLQKTVFPKNHYLSHRENLEKLRYLQFKNIKSYLNKFEELLENANMCLDPEELIKDREAFDLFHMGLLNTHKRTLRLQDCRNIDKAVLIIEGLESNNDIPEKEKIIENKKFKFSSAEQRNEPTIKDKKKGKYKYCAYHKWGGHTSVDCTKLKERKSNLNSNAFTIKEVEMVPEKLSISCKLNNHLTELTIDTGSSENVLSYSKAKELNLCIKKSQTNTIIQVASSEFLNVLGYADTILYLPELNKSLPITFKILDKFVDDIILGVKFLSKNKIDILFSSNTIRLGENYIQLSSPFSNLSLPDQEILEKTKCLLIDSRVKLHVDDFIKSSKTLGEINNIEHEINLTTDATIYSKPYPVPLSMLGQFKVKVQELLDKGIIRKSSSTIVSPCFLIIKKTGDLRLVIDYRKLNSITQKSFYPIPKLSDQVYSLKNCIIFSKLDLNSGYYQIKVKESDIYKTAFTTPFGTFEFTRMPFGLTNAPRTFQRAMNDILCHLPYVRVYLDDILICSKNSNEHIKHIIEILKILLNNNVTINVDKCEWCRTEVEYLGYIIDGEGIRPVTSKLFKDINFKTPKNRKELQRLVGFINWFRDFIPNLSSRITCLTRMTGKNSIFKWSDECQKV